MEHSPGISAISAALAMAQGQMAGAKKDSTNPHFRSNYADLASIWEACRVALSSNEIAVVQSPGELSDGVVEITTMLCHSSGEWFRDTLPIPLTKIDAQGLGSAITYGRRYSLAAMVGVAPEDDDGNAAVSSGERANAAPNDRRRPRAEYPAGPHPNRTKARAYVRTMKQYGEEAESVMAFDEIIEDARPTLKQMDQAGDEWMIGVDHEGNSFESVPAWIERRRRELSDSEAAAHNSAALDAVLNAMRQQTSRAQLAAWTELTMDSVELSDEERRIFDQQYDAYEASLTAGARLSAG